MRKTVPSRILARVATVKILVAEQIIWQWVSSRNDILDTVIGNPSHRHAN